MLKLWVGRLKRGAALAQLSNARLFGLMPYYVPREPKLSWEIGANILKQHERFSLQLGEKPCGIKSAQWTLNQRVQGSSPCAPTTTSNDINTL